MKELEKVKPYILSDKIPILAILTLTKPEQHETVTESEPNNVEKRIFACFVFLKKSFISLLCQWNILYYQNFLIRGKRDRVN